MRGQRRRSAGADLQSHVASARDPRLVRLIDSLPRHFRSTIRLLWQRSSPWLRMTLVCGGLLGFLPIVGFWMLPLGLVLLADDVSALRLARSRILDWIERRRPHWLARQPVRTARSPEQRVERPRSFDLQTHYRDAR